MLSTPDSANTADTADSSLSDAFDAFLMGKLDGASLPYPLSYCYQRGRWDVEAERDEANAAADRWHAIATRERRPAVPTRSLADLERKVRGNPQRADRLEADLRRRFGDVA